MLQNVIIRFIDYFSNFDIYLMLLWKWSTENLAVYYFCNLCLIQKLNYPFFKLKTFIGTDKNISYLKIYQIIINIIIVIKIN